MGVDPHGGQKRVSDLLELELQVTVNHQHGSRERLQEHSVLLATHLPLQPLQLNYFKRGVECVNNKKS